MRLLRGTLAIVWLLSFEAWSTAQTISPAPQPPGHKATPVVPPRGSRHPHKPAGPATSEKASPPKPSGAAAPSASTAPPPAVAEKPPEGEKPEDASLKLPRFASLRSDEVNMRVGPGLRFRIEWVYKRRELPVEIEREFDVWRWVRDADGIQGWMQRATLTGRRNFIIQKDDATLRVEASDTAPAVAILKPGVIGRIRSCSGTSNWCNVQTGSYRGYLRRGQFWGTLPNEEITP